MNTRPKHLKDLQLPENLFLPLDVCLLGLWLRLGSIVAHTETVTLCN